MISANVNDSAFSGVALKTQGSVFAKNQSLPTQSAVAIVDPTRTQVRPSADSNAPSSGSNNSRVEPGNSALNSTQDPTEAVQQVINQLKSRDAQVRAHEMAHLSAAGGYASGGASYVFQVGPDGRRYAIGGEVGIDTSPVAGDPQATLQKAMVIQRAALAPAEPSSQDMRVASLAVQMAMQARLELSAQKTEQDNQNGADNSPQSGQMQEQGIEINDSTLEPLSLMPLASENRILQSQRQEFNLRLSLQDQT